MARPRVHEVASELGIDSKVVLKALKELGEYVKAPSSAINPAVARKVKERLWADGYQPLRELFPLITEQEYVRLVECFLEFPTSLVEFMHLLSSAISPVAGASGLLQRIAQLGETFYIHGTDAGVFNQAVDRARPLELIQLFARTGVLVVEEKQPEKHRAYTLFAWNLTTEEHLEFAHIRIAVNQTDKRGIPRLELTAPQYTERSAVRGMFALGRRRDVRSLSALYSIVPIRDPLAASAQRETGSAVPSSHEESDFVRLYRFGSGERVRGVGADDGIRRSPHHVRGHVRRQPYPSTGEVKEIWIKSYSTGEGGESDPLRKPYLVKPVTKPAEIPAPQ